MVTWALGSTHCRVVYGPGGQGGGWGVSWGVRGVSPDPPGPASIFATKIRRTFRKMRILHEF